MRRPLRVLVLCTGNSARSQMAEALLTTRGAGRVEAESAGSHPVERVNPLAIEALAELGIDWAGRSPRAVSSLPTEGWDVVLTVCDGALEACPVFPFGTVHAHWGQPDPAALEGTHAERLAAFRAARDLLAWRVDQLLGLDLRPGQVGVWREALREIGTREP